MVGNCTKSACCNIDDYGDDEKYVIKLGFKELADCFDKCDVGIEITPGSVVVTATIIDTSDEAEPPDASIFTSDTIATELAAVAEAEGIESLMEVSVEYVAEPVTTYTTVTTVVSAIPPSPPPSPSPVASPPSDVARRGGAQEARDGGVGGRACAAGGRDRHNMRPAAFLSTRGAKLT